MLVKERKYSHYEDVPRAMLGKSSSKTMTLGGARKGAAQIEGNYISVASRALAHFSCVCSVCSPILFVLVTILISCKLT